MKTLITERLILNKFNYDDVEAAFKTYMSDPRVTTYLTWEHHKDSSVSFAFIDSVIRNYTNPHYYNWAIRLKDDGKIIGSISIVKCDEALKTIETGYVLAHDYWNQGIMTEALKSVIAYTFNETPFETFTACHDHRNKASGKVMLKSGMYYVGTERRKEKEEITIDCYQITKSDYLEQNQKYENLIVETLLKNRCGCNKIAVAESCTGGAVVNRLITVPNASKIIGESYVTYQDEVKCRVLNVDKSIIDNHGAASIETAKAMVHGLYDKTNADICISVTGYTNNVSDLKHFGKAYVGCLIKNKEKVFILPALTDYTLTRSQIMEKQVDQILASIWNEVAVLTPFCEYK